jgi:hypothetical protein
MPHSSELAITLGGVAYVALALVRIFGMHALTTRPEQAAAPQGMSRQNALLMIYRQIFIFLAFGSVSLLHATELATTRLGFTLVVTMALFLLLKAGEHVYAVEVRRQRLHLEFALALLGGAAYVWAVTGAR